MSVDIEILFSNNVSLDEWQQQINNLKFNLTLEKGLDILKHEGAFQCVYNNKDCEFEYFYVDKLDNNFIEQFSKEEALLIGERNKLVVISFENGELDGEASVIAAASLTIQTDGVLLDNGNELYASSSALEWSKVSIQKYRK